MRMSGQQPSPLDDSDYREIAEEIAAEEIKEPDEGLPSGEQPGPLEDSDYREIAKEIAQETKGGKKDNGIPEERKDEEKRLVLKKVYSEGTSAVAFWISFILSGLTLALYLLTNYPPLLWISTFFAAIWLFFLVIPRSSA
jgi:hypothetical protein